MGRRLGQHFLKSESALEKIAAAVCMSGGDVVVEVGPGHGELTKHLIAGGARVIALERDARLAGALRGTQQFSSVEIIEGDALKTFPVVAARLKKEKISYVLAGNIPYYITGHLLHILGDTDYKPVRTVLLIQKEVAGRICAEPPRMNLLAATIRPWASPRILLSVPRGSFAPPPEVDSAVVVLESMHLPFRSSDLSAYFPFVRALFGHPRKTILNNLLGHVSLSRSDIMRRCSQIDVDPLGRPQVLTVKKIVGLFRLFGTPA